MAPVVHNEYPTGKAQDIVLEALGLKAPGAQSADRLFASLGLVVRPVRQGRRSVPQIRLQNRPCVGGGFTPEGDGESWVEEYEELTPAQLAAIEPWIVK